MQKQTKKNTASKPATGLGDTVEKITEATGIKKAVELFSELTGLDCGCDNRKELLNKLFPYRKPNCLNETDYNYLKAFFDAKTTTLTPIVQRELSAIYLNVFNTNLAQTSCDSCWRDTVSELRRIYNEY